MSTLAFVGVVLAFWLVCTAIVALFFERTRRGPWSDPPEAAEAPDPVDVVHDGYERAKYFTGEEETAALVACVAHLKVCGMNDTQIAAELGSMVHVHLSDLWSAPARLGEFYVAPEVER